MVSGRCLSQRVARREQCGDEIGANYTSRGWFWACGSHGDGAVRTFGMRGDRVGVADISAMPCGAWCSGDAACGDDGRRAIRQRDRRILVRYWSSQLEEGIQQGRDRVDVSDGARGWFWACGAHSDDAVRTVGMRGDRVGVGDIGAMPCGARRTGDASCGDDGRGVIRERDGDMLSGPRLCQRFASSSRRCRGNLACTGSREPCWYRVGIDDGARVEPWAC